MLKQLLEWEYHFNSKHYGESWSKEAIFKHSKTTLSSSIGLFYFCPTLFIFTSLLIYQLDYQFKVNKHLGALPFGLLMLLFIWGFKRKLIAPINIAEIATSTFNQKLSTRTNLLLNFTQRHYDTTI